MTQGTPTADGTKSAAQEKAAQGKAAPKRKPNTLVIWGDDIGIWNLSGYSSGMMGYHTPNIDRLANEGMRFTDSCGEQSCTAGRAALITGAANFTIDQALQKMESSLAGAGH